MQIFIFVNERDAALVETAHNGLIALLSIAEYHDLKCDPSLFKELITGTLIDESIRIFNVLCKDPSDHIKAMFASNVTLYCRCDEFEEGLRKI